MSMVPQLKDHIQGAAQHFRPQPQHGDAGYHECQEAIVATSRQTPSCDPVISSKYRQFSLRMTA